MDSKSEAIDRKHPGAQTLPWKPEQAHLYGRKADDPSPPSHRSSVTIISARASPVMTSFVLYVMNQNTKPI